MKWNEQELNIMIEKYSNTHIDELCLLLPNRTKKSILEKAKKMKLKKEKIFINPKLWSEDDINFLKNNINNYTNDELASMMGRTKKSILSKIEKLGIKRNKMWSCEEEEIMIENYPHMTNEELIILFDGKFNKKQLYSKARKLGLVKTNDTLKKIKPSIESKKKMSETRLKKIKNNEIIPLKGIKRSSDTRNLLSIKAKERGVWKGDNNPRHLNPLFGEENGRWLGGITNLSTALREQLYTWKKESMEFCNYKCVITGKDFDNIHHVYPFNKIIKEVFNELNLQIKNSLIYYTEEQQANIKKLVIEKHKEYGLGVCLCKEAHKLFHDLYSYDNFDKSNFDEFVLRCNSGEFDNILF